MTIDEHTYCYHCRKSRYITPDQMHAQSRFPNDNVCLYCSATGQTRSKNAKANYCRFFDRHPHTPEQLAIMRKRGIIA